MQVRAAKVRGKGHKNLESFPDCNIFQISSSSESGSSTASLSTSALSTSSRVLTIYLPTLIRIGLHALSFGRSFFLMFLSSKTSKCTLVAPFNCPIFGMICWTLLMSSFVWIKISIEIKKKLFPALCWDTKYICWLNMRPCANDGSTRNWGVLDVSKHPILTRLG